MPQTQFQLSAAARVPLSYVKKVEAGLAAEVRLGRLRRIMEASGGRARLVPWWNGAAADRVLDERHAELVERVVEVLRARGWSVDVEVSFSEYGERGSIDVLGTHERRRAVGVCEVKSAIGSLEETNRVLDVKARLDQVTTRTLYAARRREARAWLREPAAHPRHLVCVIWTDYVQRFGLTVLDRATWTWHVQLAQREMPRPVRWTYSVRMAQEAVAKRYEPSLGGASWRPSSAS